MIRKLLLLNEPAANLDPANVTKIEEIIKGIRNERGTNIVLATHNIPRSGALPTGWGYC